MRSRLSLFLAPLAIVVLLAASACSVGTNRHISRATVQPAALDLNRAVSQTDQSQCGPTASAQPLDSGSHASTIANAYQDILRVFIRPLDSSSLLNAAWDGATSEATKEGMSDTGISAPQLDDSSADADWQTFAASYDQLTQATMGRVDQQKMAFAAISKMADSVNEGHTYFDPPEDYVRMASGREQVLSGGIGVVLNGSKAPFVVQEVVPGAPADQAGVKPGDSITAVDGCDVSDWEAIQLTSRVRGDAGTAVHLTFNRPSSGNYDANIVRAQVTFPDITSMMLPQGVGYVHLHEFPSPSTTLATGKTLTASLTDIINGFQAQGARGWVLDLRGNPGGEVSGVQAVGGLLLPPGIMFSTADRAGHKSNIRTTGNRISGPPLLAVLVDKASASGSEITSAAIQDEGVAPIIGTQTAGVANEAELLGIGDGAGMSVTVAQTYSPHGRPLNGTGLTPDITIERTPDDLAAGIDPPLDRAVQMPAPSQANQSTNGQ
jgi:carboxyl-terminal processing protease